MSRMALKVLVLVFLMAVMSLAIVSTVSAAVCPGGPGPTCIELRVENPPNPNNTPTFTDGATVQTWPIPGVPGCLPDVTPNWPGPLGNVDSTAPVAPPIQLCYNNFSLWVSSGRDTGAMAGSKCINDLENVAFESPAGKLFTSVSIELKCLGPATRLHDVQVYYYISPGVLCEQQLIEPPALRGKATRRSWRQLLHPWTRSRPIPYAPLGFAGLRSSLKSALPAALSKSTTFGRRPSRYHPTCKGTSLA